MQGFLAKKGLSVGQSPSNNVSFSGSISIGPSGFGFSWNPEDARIIPNLVEAIFDAIDIFRNRIKGIKIDGKSCSIDEAKVTLEQVKRISPFMPFEMRMKPK